MAAGWGKGGGFELQKLQVMNQPREFKKYNLDGSDVSTENGFT